MCDWKKERVRLAETTRKTGTACERPLCLFWMALKKKKKERQNRVCLLRLKDDDSDRERLIRLFDFYLEKKVGRKQEKEKGDERTWIFLIRVHTRVEMTIKTRRWHPR